MNDCNSLHPLNDKIKSISAAPAPKNVTELKSFYGYCSTILDSYTIWQLPLCYCVMLRPMEWVHF